MASVTGIQVSFPFKLSTTGQAVPGEVSIRVIRSWSSDCSRSAPIVTAFKTFGAIDSPTVKSPWEKKIVSQFEIV